MEFKQFHQPVGKDCFFQSLTILPDVPVQGQQESPSKAPHNTGSRRKLPSSYSDWHCFSLLQSKSQKTMGRVAHLTIPLLCLFTENKLQKPHERSSWMTAMLVTGWHHINKRVGKEEACRYCSY